MQRITQESQNTTHRLKIEEAHIGQQVEIYILGDTSHREQRGEETASAEKEDTNPTHLGHQAEQMVTQPEQGTKRNMNMLFQVWVEGQAHN